VLTCLFHSFLDENVESQPYVASGHGKGRSSASIWTCFFVVFDARRILFDTLFELEEVEALDPLRFEILFGLQIDEDDRLRLFNLRLLGL
jgi:hypothetical protein